MKTVAVASLNAVKVNAVRAGFLRMFPDEQFSFQMVAVPSGVADQPASNREALQGALNRAENAFAEAPQADFWVGVEGGIEDYEGDLYVEKKPVRRSMEASQ